MRFVFNSLLTSVRLSFFLEWVSHVHGLFVFAFLRNLRDPVDLEEKLGRHKGFYWLYFAPRLSIEFL